jgi:squalene-associated FAD-dependent desaturase
MTVHIVGGGLSGLAAAVSLSKSGVKVALYEAAAQAGGRCRSYHDRTLDRFIDNGNHLVLSGNDNVQEYLRIIGAGDRLAGPVGEGFRFLDLTRNREFTLRPNNGPLPWWIAAPGRRAPQSTAFQYLSLIKLAFAGPGTTVAEVLPHDELYRVLWEPLAVSALNTPADEASAQGFWRVIKKTLARGGAFAQPLIARHDLSDTFIAPALAFLEGHHARIRFNARVKKLVFNDKLVTGLDLDEGAVDFAPGDQVVMAASPAIAERMVPGLETPTADEPIVNAHFATRDGADTPIEVVAIVGGAAQWVFRRPGLTSVTVSAARAMAEQPADEIAVSLWADVARAFPALGDTMPPYRIVKEKRATIRQAPSDEAIRPEPGTAFHNLLLAGDWTRTGLPATIEGSILSGFRAARLAKTTFSSFTPQ